MWLGNLKTVVENKLLDLVALHPRKLMSCRVHV